MKKYYFPELPGTKVYFTEADPSSQRFYIISYGEFDLKIKLWLLFSDYVIISAGHMIRSPITFKWLKSNENIMDDLLRDKVILPSIREDITDIKEFVLRSFEEKESAMLDKTQKRVLLERGKILSDMFDFAITWSPMGESNLFKEILANDLIERNSPLRKRLVGVPNSAIKELYKNIMGCESFDRYKFTELVRKYCPQRERILCRYRDLFYYLSGAIFKDAFPIFHPEATALCMEKVSHSSRTVGLIDSKHDVWHEILDTWGITLQTFSAITLRDILDIRKSELGKQVRQKWGKILEEARLSSLKEDSLYGFISKKEELLKILKNEIDRQKKRHQFFSKIRGNLEVLSWATGGLATFLGFCLTSDIVVSSLIGWGAGILGFLAGKPILDTVEKKIPGTELVLLSTKITEKAYGTYF